MLSIGLIARPSSGPIMRDPRPDIEAVALLGRLTGFNVRTQRRHRNDCTSDQSRTRNSKNEF